MAYSQIAVEQSGAVTTVTLNRPDALNAITPAMLSELKAALNDIHGDADTGLVILTGAGRAFSAGVDLKALGDRTLENGGVGPILDDPANQAIDLIQNLPQIVIAKINGHCFTGALELALGCDLIVVAEEAKLGDTHVKFGLRPSWGMSQRLPQMVGVMRARELSYTARTFSGTEAAEMGLALKAVPRDQLDQTVNELAESILANSREALAAVKRLYNDGGAKSLEDGLAHERTSVFPITDTDERLKDFRSK